ncbi:hypothetical protein YC2023_115186 [Brassica napus]
MLNEPTRVQLVQPDADSILFWYVRAGLPQVAQLKEREEVSNMDGRHVFHKRKEQEDQKTASKFDDVYLKISVKRIFMSKVNKAPLTCAKMVSGYQSRYPSLPPQSTTSRRGGGGRVRGKAAPPRPTGAAIELNLHVSLYLVAVHYKADIAAITSILPRPSFDSYTAKLHWFPVLLILFVPSCHGQTPIITGTT